MDPKATQNWCYRITVAILASLLCIVSTTAASKPQELRKVYFQQTKPATTQIALVFAKPISKKSFRSFVTKTARGAQSLVIDLPHVVSKIGSKRKTMKSTIANSLIAIQGKNKTRVVVNLLQTAGYKVYAQKNRLIITLGKKLHKTASRKKSLISRHKPGQNWIKNIDFKRTKSGGGKVIVTLGTDKNEVDITQTGSIVNLEFLSTYLPKKIHRTLDVTDFATPVDNIKLKQVGNKVQMHIQPHGKFSHLAYQSKNKFIVDFEPIKEAKANSGSTVLRTNYNGDKVTLNFQNIEVRSVLQLLAEFTGLNIVTDDSVTGSITLHLQNVPWDQALHIILRMRGLAERQIGNVILVAPAKSIAAREKSELQSLSQIQKLSPLGTELIQINYARAADIAALIKSQKSSILSTRGRISSDARTNTIWIRDTQSKLDDIRLLVRKLDIPVRQVSIEARIVTVDRKFLSDIGIAFGVSKTQTALSGTFQAANEFKQNTLPASIGTAANRFNVNLPNTKTATGSIGLALAKLGHGFMLDMELSAMESDEKGQVISAPHLITANQHTAKIEKGSEIPFNQSTSSGAAAITFKKAVLSLEVTPQITPDKKVTLNIVVHKDSPNESLSNGTTALAIDTNNIETQVQIENGATIVIGGIYEKTKKNILSRVPFFSKLPFIGQLFDKTSKLKEQKELLVFITPKIIEQQAFSV